MSIDPKGGFSSTSSIERPLRQSSIPSAVISISWSSLAFAAGAIAISATSSLAILATLNHADSLSTIALALAILSFIIQIGLFIAQSWTAGQQVLHSEEVNSDTRSILAEVRENSRGTNQLLTEQFEQVLGHLLETTKRTVNESIKGQEARVLNDRLDRELRRALRDEAQSAAMAQEARRARQRDLARREREQEQVPLTREQRNLLAVLRTPISNPAELQEANSIVQSLTPAAIADLNNFAIDQISAILSGGVPGLFQSLVPHVGELVKAGLVAKTDPSPRWADIYPNQDYFVLTPKGLKAARLFLAPNENKEKVNGSDG